MRSVIRKPSIKKSVSARTSGRVTRTVKKVLIPAYGKKGTGYIKGPKKALYNKLYNKTSYSIQNGISSKHSYTASSNHAKPIKPSDTCTITNHNISDLLQEYPQLTKSIFRQCIKRILFGILLFTIACLCIFAAKSQFLFIIGLVLLGVAIYHLYKGNQYRNAYLDAKKHLHKMHTDNTLELLHKLHS